MLFRSGVSLHGLAGEAVRSRLGDAGLLASDLVEELPYARKRLAAVRAKQGGRRVGFGAPKAGPDEPASASRTRSPPAELAGGR